MNIQIKKLDPTTPAVSAALLRRIGPALSLALALLASAFVFLSWLSLGAAGAQAQGPIRRPPASPLAEPLSAPLALPTVQPAASHPLGAAGAELGVQGLSDDVALAVTRGANRLVALQADLTEDNAGNGNPDGDPNDAGWDWVVPTTATSHTSSASPRNLYGATARGILAAQRVSSKTAYATALLDAANTISANASIRSGPDIVFLLDMADMVGNQAYAQTAAGRYQARLAAAGGSAQDLADLIRDTRAITQGLANGVIPWDIAAWVKAAQRLDETFPGQGYAADAEAMTQVIWDDMYLSPGDPNYTGYFSPTDTSEGSYYLGLSGALWAFTANDTHPAEAAQLVSTLVAAQKSDGSWPQSSQYPADPDYQTTAFVANALLAYGKAHANGAALNAPGRASAWLVAQQLPSGGWGYSDGNEYPEEDGEVAWALAQAQAALPASLTLQADPASISASGLSTTTLSATVLDEAGQPVPDGTAVVFSSTLGYLDNWTQLYTTTTTGGVAVAVLNSAPSGATVTATVRVTAGAVAGDANVPFLAIPCQEDLTSWQERVGNPVFDPPSGDRAYYPTVIYDAGRFNGHGAAAYYKLWYTSGDNRLGFATSEDGIAWTEVYTQLSGLTNPHHARVIYDADGFGGDGITYKMWYWDTAGIYNVAYLRYAESADGVVWTDDQSVTQDAAMPIVSGADNTWNRGTYGPVDVLYNPGGSATLDDVSLWNNRYVMYYDGTTGAFEQVGLAYSADGKLWKRYGDGPVLPSGSDWRGAWGSPSTWDSSYASYGTVMRTPDGGYRFWYSGGATSADQGIGYAVSADGIHWSKSLDNPIFHKSDGVAWRNDRTYTPIVLYAANGFGGNGPAAAYKMWFTGRDVSTHNYAIGFAALQAAVGLDYVSGNGQSGNVATGLSHPFVVRAMDTCSQPAPGVPVTFAIAGWPATATLTGTLSVTNAVTVAPSGEVSSTITLGDVDGVYTVTAESEGLSGSPVVFTASASLVQSPRWLSYLPIIFKH